MAKRTFFPKDMLRVADACDVAGISQRTMWRLLRDGDAPPFVMVGRQRRWRYDFLVAYRKKETELRGEVSDYPDLNSATATVTTWTIEAAAEAVGAWKERELWRRAMVVMSDHAFLPEQSEKFEAEAALVDPNRTEKDDAIWHQRITDKTIEIATSLGFSLANPPQNEEERAARNALKHLLIFTYSEILAAEAKWRTMDWASMPKAPPSTTE